MNAYVQKNRSEKVAYLEIRQRLLQYMQPQDVQRTKI